MSVSSNSFTLWGASRDLFGPVDGFSTSQRFLELFGVFRHRLQILGHQTPVFGICERHRSKDYVSYLTSIEILLLTVVFNPVFRILPVVNKPLLLKLI